MALTLNVRPGLSAPLINSIPTSWDAQWFRRWVTDFLNTQQINSGVVSIGGQTGAVTLAGTTNEITVTAAGGAITLAFAPNVVIPAPPSGVPLVVNGISTQNVANFVSGSTGTFVDVAITRTGNGTANVLASGANLYLSSGSYDTILQSSGNQFEIWMFDSSAWAQAFYIDSSRAIHGLGSGLTGTAPNFIAGGITIAPLTGNLAYGLLGGATVTSEGYFPGLTYNPATQLLTVTGYIARATTFGFLSGSFNTVESGITAGCVYAIGPAYIPNSGSTNALGTLYGIGYTESSTTNGSGSTIAASTGATAGRWGMYVASSGTARIFLDADIGVVSATSALTTPGYVSAGPVLSTTGGDVSANRGGTGAIFLGTSGTYLYFSGSVYSMPSAQVQAVQFFATSDRDMKTNIRPIDGALARLAKLTGVTFEWNARAGKIMRGIKSAGLIAQDVELVLKESVTLSSVGPDKKLKPHRVLDYNGPIGLLVNAVNELRERVEQLEAA